MILSEEREPEGKMVYAIEEMKIAAAGFAACGGTYGKGKREKAVILFQ